MGASEGIADLDPGFAEKVRSLIPCHRLVVTLVQPEVNQAAIAYVDGADVPGEGVGTSFAISGTPLETVLQTRTGSVCRGDPTMAGTGFASSMSVPLLSRRQQVLGVLSFHSTSMDAYSEQDMALADRIAAEIVGPVADAQALARFRRDAEDAKALEELGHMAVSAPTTGDLYESWTQRLRGLIGSDRVELFMVSTDGETLTSAYSSGLGLPGGEDRASAPLAETMLEEAIRTRSPVLVQGQSASEVQSRFPSLTNALEAGLRSFLLAPLVSAGAAVGAVTLSSSAPNAFTERDVALIKGASLLLAGPVAVARMEAENGPAADEVAALASIGRIITSAVDIGEVYGRFAEKVRELVPWDRLALWTVDLQRENLIVSYVAGADVPGMERGRVFPLKGAPPTEPLSLRAGGVTVQEGSAQALAGLPPDLLQGTTPGLPSMLLVPLRLGSETTGILSLRSTTPDAYTERDVAVAERIGAQIAGAVANAQVYRETKQVEDAVREAVERLEVAIAGSGEGLWDWKIASNEVWWSPELRDLLGSGEQDGYGGQRGWEARLHPDDRDRVQRSLADHLEHRAPYEMEYRLRVPSGEYRWFSDRGQAIWDDAGAQVRMSGSLRDVSEAKEAGLPRKPGSLDLREPVAMIESFRRPLLEGKAIERDEDGSTIATRMASAGRRMASLIADLRTLSWVMDTEVRRESVNLSAIARSVVRRLRRDSMDRKVTFSIARDLVVEGDPRLLRVMLENLLHNAWKFTGKHPGARIELRAAREDGESVYYVRDKGAGFDMAQSERLFRLFQRLHAPEDFEGTGVGLATVRHIVRRHGGNIWAESEVGRGATFYFTL